MHLVIKVGSLPLAFLLKLRVQERNSVWVNHWQESTGIAEGEKGDYLQAYSAGNWIESMKNWKSCNKNHNVTR